MNKNFLGDKLTTYSANALSVGLLPKGKRLQQRALVVENRTAEI